MNFIFAITAHGFEKAAKVEAMLKEIGVPFNCKQQVGPTNTRSRRKVLSKSEVLAVIATCDIHPEWTDRVIGEQAGVSENTVNRIRRGLHPLCPKKVKA